MQSLKRLTNPTIPPHREGAVGFVGYYLAFSTEFRLVSVTRNIRAREARALIKYAYCITGTAEYPLEGEVKSQVVHTIDTPNKSLYEGGIAAIGNPPIYARIIFYGVRLILSSIGVQSI